MGHEEIAEAINCAEWQRFRKSLKGQSTEDKLKELKAYLLDDTGVVHNCFMTRRIKQVQNYLHALARGGQLDVQSTVDKLLKGTLTIRR